MIGKNLSVEQQVELRQIVETEASAILSWGLAAIPPERREAYLRRCGVAECPAGARYPNKN